MKNIKYLDYFFIAMFVYKLIAEEERWPMPKWAITALYLFATIRMGMALFDFYKNKRKNNARNLKI